MPDYERKERIVTVLGSTAVGKSALSLMFVENRFIEFYEPTINKSYIKNEFRLNGREYEIRVNDTFGLDQYSNIPENYFNSHGYVLVYSITNPQSLETVRDIYNNLCNDLGRKPNVIVVGNKSDLNGQRKVGYEEGKKLAEPWGATFLEISAKHPNNVVDVFETLLTQIDPPEVVAQRNNSDAAAAAARRESESHTGKSQSKLSQFWDMFKFRRASSF